MALLLCLYLLTFLHLSATAATVQQNAVIITEIQMTGDSASEEFIELYNATSEDIAFSSQSESGQRTWKLQFFNSTTVAKGAPDWSQPTSTITLTGTIPAHGYFILSSKNYDPGEYVSDQYYAHRLASTGGALQLISSVGTDASEVYDQLAWSSARASLPGIWPAPSYGGSMHRVPGEDEDYMLKLDDSVTFINDATISPHNSWTALLEIDETEAITEPDENFPAAGEVSESLPKLINTGLADPYITELLPNPASPSRDESDEYIELYNPNEHAFSLKGYTLQVGNTKRYDFLITSDFILPPRQYVALYADDTRLVLSNTGSQARLIDPEGKILSQTEAYTEAKDDVAWALVDGTWHWTYAITPGQMNVMEVAVMSSKAGATAAAAKKASAKAAVSKVKGKTISKTKTKAKTKAAKAKKEAKPKVASIATVVQEPQKSTIHTGILVGVAGLAVLYGAYEYRYDIANRIHRLRHYRAVRR